MFNRVYRLEIQSVMLVFQNQLFELLCCLSNLLSGSTPPPTPPPIPKVNVQYKQKVCGQEGVGGVELCWRPFSLFMTKFITYKTATQSQTKTQVGRWPQTDKHLPQLGKRHLALLSISLIFLRPAPYTLIHIYINPNISQKPTNCWDIYKAMASNLKVHKLENFVDSDCVFTIG